MSSRTKEIRCLNKGQETLSAWSMNSKFNIWLMWPFDLLIGWLLIDCVFLQLMKFDIDLCFDSNSAPRAQILMRVCASVYISKCWEMINGVHFWKSTHVNHTSVFFRNKLKFHSDSFSRSLSFICFRLLTSRYWWIIVVVATVAMAA